MNVLIIPEDLRKDEYILKPIFRRLFRSVSREYECRCATTHGSAASAKR